MNTIVSNLYTRTDKQTQNACRNTSDKDDKNLIILQTIKKFLLLIL